MLKGMQTVNAVLMRFQIEMRVLLGIWPFVIFWQRTSLHFVCVLWEDELKNDYKGQAWWLRLVIPATLEAEDSED
jgi:hypothetical protein